MRRRFTQRRKDLQRLFVSPLFRLPSPISRQGGKLAVTFEGQGRVEMDLPTGAGFVGGPITDATKNIGKTTIKLLIVDMYRPRGNTKIN